MEWKIVTKNKLSSKTHQNGEETMSVEVVSSDRHGTLLKISTNKLKHLNELEVSEAIIV